MTKRKQGFTLIEIMIVVAIIGMLAAIAIPAFVKSRNTAQQNTCINNLRLIDGGKEQAATVNKWVDGATVTSAIVDSYIKGGSVPLCQAGGVYTYSAVGTNPTCSIQTPTSHRLPTGQ